MDLLAVPGAGLSSPELTARENIREPGTARIGVSDRADDPMEAIRAMVAATPAGVLERGRHDDVRQSNKTGNRQ